MAAAGGAAAAPITPTSGRGGGRDAFVYARNGRPLFPLKEAVEVGVNSVVSGFFMGLSLVDYSVVKHAIHTGDYRFLAAYCVWLSEPPVKKWVFLCLGLLLPLILFSIIKETIQCFTKFHASGVLRAFIVLRSVLLFGVIGVAVTMAGPLQHAVAVETEPDARAELAAQLSVAYLGMLLVNVVLAIISLIIQGTTEALHQKEKEE